MTNSWYFPPTAAVDQVLVEFGVQPNQAAADTAAGFPGTPVPADRVYTARLTDGTLLFAYEGDTGFTSPASTGSLVTFGNQATTTAADAAAGVPGAPVPAGRVYQAQLPDGTLLHAFEGDTAFTPTSGIDPSVVFIADGATGGPTVDGDRVVAEQNSTVQIPAGLEEFWLVEDTTNPWTETPLTTPDVQPPAGETLDPGLQITTAADGGGPILMHRKGTVWYAAQNAGGAGGGGADVDSYTHNQAAAATVWSVAHNLGFRPAGVLVQDTGGDDIVPDDINHVDDNNLTITFLAAQAGTAIVS